MATLQELIAQKEALEREIELTQKQDRSEALNKIRTLMSQYGLSMADLSGKSSGRGAARDASANGGGSKVAAKYRNTATGDTWSGRGLQPKWLRAALAAGKKIEEFAV